MLPDHSGWKWLPKSRILQACYGYLQIWIRNTFKVLKWDIFCDFPTLWCYIWNYSDLHKFRIFFIIHSWNILVNREVACWEILTLFQMTCFTLNRWQLLNRILLKWNVSSLSRSLFGVVNSWCEILENVLTNAVWFIIKCPLGKFDLKNKTKLTEYYCPPCLKKQPNVSFWIFWSIYIHIGMNTAQCVVKWFILSHFQPLWFVLKILEVSSLLPQSVWSMPSSWTQCLAKQYKVVNW